MPTGAAPQLDAVRLAEAILFVAGEPVPGDRLATALGVDATELPAVLAGLDGALAGRGLCLLRHGATVQIVTAPDLARGIERYLGLPTVQRLSHAALEALAVVAYRQPATRAQVEAVRGVDSAGVLGTLLARGLIEEVGRLAGPGHPVQLGTTPEFLRLFGLASVAELPALAADDGTPLAAVWERRLAARPPEPA
ncbi:MAG: SMC-Scp complex subunit ScpB [Chloroflexi bacterium]|nr:SMC-Scp complex subunit ScpB [Chloroflexota bacterium]